MLKHFLANHYMLRQHLGIPLRLHTTIPCHPFHRFTIHTCDQLVLYSSPSVEQADGNLDVLPTGSKWCVPRGHLPLNLRQAGSRWNETSRFNGESKTKNAVDTGGRPTDYFQGCIGRVRRWMYLANLSGWFALRLHRLKASRADLLPSASVHAA